MSPIDTLKAEAAALRETEKAAGREIKHSEALERIARKHGYENWRSCVALLGAASAPESAPQPPATLPVASEGLQASMLSGGEAESGRTNAFTLWMAPTLRQAAVDFSRNIGLLPIYCETSDKGVRYLFWKPPIGTQYEVRADRTKAEFIAFHEKNAGLRRLLSLHIHANVRYSAVWISADHYEAAARYLARFGIGCAEASDNPL